MKICDYIDVQLKKDGKSKLIKFVTYNPEPINTLVVFRYDAEAITVSLGGKTQEEVWGVISKKLTNEENKELDKDSKDIS